MFNFIALATSNKGKVKEFNELLKDFPIHFKSLSDFPPLPPVKEDGETFDDNAYKKAHHYAKILGVPAIADDSGICVDALGGRPGVFSARYASEKATDQENCRKLLAEMKNERNRKASFHCVLSIAVPSGPAITYEARCDGLILEEPSGENGFGYDPIFFYEPFGKSFAELTMEEKNRVSHRGKVMSELRSEFSKVMKWLESRIREEFPPQPDPGECKTND